MSVDIRADKSLEGILLNNLAVGMKVDREHAEQMFTILKGVMTWTIVETGMMTIPGIGTFERVSIPATGRTISGGDQASSSVVDKPAVQKIVFKASESLEKALND